ncbi:MAG: response regulator transcription factor [Bacteroidota bacterium]
MKTNTIKALLVDDEERARRSLTKLLIRFCPEVQILGQAANVGQALEQLRIHKPELVFLDIEMPKQSGFELIHALGSPDFYIIFITAYDQYAIKAFEVSAIDYLLKPVAVERLQKAVRKVLLQQQQQDYADRFEVLKTNTTGASFEKLVVPYKGGHVHIDIEDIIAIEADRMYSSLFVLAHKKNIIKTYLYSRELGYMEKLFEHVPHLYRIHRSWLVNTRHIQFYSKKERSIVLKHNLIVPVSKSRKPAFEIFMGF